MRTTITALAALALLVLPVSYAAAQTTTTQSPTTQSTTTSSNPDAQFVDEAASGGPAEVELGRLAVQKATNPDVKQFAQRMVNDHGAANAELATMCGGKGITLPTEPEAKDRAIRDRLATLSGPAFDREYMTDMLTDHQQAVSDFQREAQNGRDPEVRAWAAKTLPVLQDHLRMAQTIQSRIAQAPVVTSPSASVVTTTVVRVAPWCGGAYSPTGGTNFGACKTP